MAFFVQINPAEMKEVRDLVAEVGKESGRALVRGVNRTLPGVRTDMTDALYRQYALTRTRIRETFTLVRASLAKRSGLVATKGRFLHLADYGARATKTGVSVKVLRTGSRKVVTHAFLAKAGSGKEMVLSRKYRGERKKVRPGFPYARMPERYRLPVEALFGPRIQDHLEKPAIRAEIERKAVERFLKAVAHEADCLIRQKLEAGEG